MDNEKTTVTKNDKNQKVQITLNGSKGLASIYDLLHCLIVAVIAVVAILTFAFRMVNVDGDSMMNTLINDDKVIVTDLFYTPKDGDIVVISHGAEYSEPIIKRVIATEGQTLDINFDTGEVVVDGVVLQESYIIGNTIKGSAEIPSVIPEGKVFVMGDNRTVSLDSRYEEIGLIDEKDIIGKAQFVAIPSGFQLDRFGFIYK